LRVFTFSLSFFIFSLSFVIFSGFLGVIFAPLSETCRRFFRRAPSLGGISANRYLNVSRTSRSNEVALSLLFCWGTRIHKRRWVYSRLLQQARDRNFSASKQGVSRNKLRSVTSKEALYA
jgi:hypothetical protein